MTFVTAFDVPDVARGIVGRFVSREEVALVEGVDALPAKTFTARDAATVLSAGTEECWDEARARALLDAAYRRGVLRRAGDDGARFSAASFYERLCTMVVAQPDEYLALDAAIRSALDVWCFERYLGSLGNAARPTSDRVATLSEACDFIDSAEQQIWLSRCDCRTLAGRCDMPVETCISFRSGDNTAADRGWSRPLGKAEAKRVVREANKAGLMQTISDHGICNCCAGCCYLFRAQEARGSGRAWPESTTVVAVDADACALCAACVERCPFDVFDLGIGGLVASVERCRGCGLCAEDCPPGVITYVATPA